MTQIYDLNKTFLVFIKNLNNTLTYLTVLKNWRIFLKV
jgi:hypothetical protein